MARDYRRGFPSLSMGAQDLSGPTWRVRGLPIDALTRKGFRGPASRMGFPDPTFLTGFDDRHSLHGVCPERPGGRSRFVDVGDKDWAPDAEDSTLHETTRPYSVFSSSDHYPERNQRSESRRVGFAPGPHDSGAELRPEERQFRAAVRRRPTPGSDSYRHRDPNSVAPKDVGLPFGKAMRWLYEGLIEMEKVLKKFQDEYNKDVNAVEKYAGVGTLSLLWIEKVTSKPISQFGSQNKQTTEKWVDKFTDKGTSLREAMNAALNASVSLGDRETPKATVFESRERLQEKVETAGHHIIELFDLVTKRSEHCKSLLDELKLLKDLVDPKRKENRESYGETEVGVTNSGQDHGGGYAGDNNDDSDADGGGQPWSNN